MIRTIDAITLATTKLRTRKVRTIITIFIASLLFGVLFFAIIALQGSIDSVSNFTKGDLSSRYLVSTSYYDLDSGIYNYNDKLPESVKARAVEIYKQLIIDKKEAAKKLGIEYDQTIELNPIIKESSGGKESLNLESESVRVAFNEFVATLPTSKQGLEARISLFKTSHSYDLDYFNTFQSSDSAKTINNEKEKFVIDENVNYDSSQQLGLDVGWSYLDQSLVQPFMFSVNQLEEQTNLNAIPVIAPIGRVEEALGLKKLPKNANAEQKLERIRYIRDNGSKVTFSVCFRNSISQQQIKDAIIFAKEIEAKRLDKGYIMPSLAYGLPDASSCAPALIRRDVRTFEEKKLATKQAQFDSQFGEEVVPIQQMITFRVVGLSPNYSNSEGFSAVNSLISIIMGSNFGGQWVVPRQMFDAMPNKQDFNRFLGNSRFDKKVKKEGEHSIIVEFDNANDTKNFVKNVICEDSEKCDAMVSASLFGSNSVLIDDIRTKATQILSYVAIVVTTIAVVIMMGMTGRIISDGRRETAVFRAIGAKRNDIKFIYITYTIILSLIIAATSLCIGILTAVIINGIISPEVTVQAHLTYIFSSDSLSFSIIGIWWQALFVVICMVINAGLIGISLPLMRNLTRNPMKDMRDDT